jgi:hypothetical protein
MFPTSGLGFQAGPSTDGTPKPYFAPRTLVRYNFGAKGIGRVVGLASQHVIDIWIVETVTRDNWTTDLYPWPVITVPHHGLSELTHEDELTLCGRTKTSSIEYRHHPVTTSAELRASDVPRGTDHDDLVND